MISLQQTLFSVVKNWTHSPKIRKKTRVSTFTTVIQHSSGSSSYVNQRRKIKGIQIRKEEVKFSLFADDMILYLENPKDSIRKLLELISEFSKVAGYKIIHRNHLHFYILTEKSEREIKESIPFTTAKKKNPDRKRNKALTVCRWHDTVHRKP